MKLSIIKKFFHNIFLQKNNVKNLSSIYVWTIKLACVVVPLIVIENLFSDAFLPYRIIDRKKNDNFRMKKNKKIAS